MAQTFNVDIIIKVLKEQFGNLQDVLEGFDALSDAARQINGLKVSTRIADDFARIDKRVRELTDDIDKLNKTEFRVDVAATISAQLEFAIKELRTLQAEARNVNDQLQFDNLSIAISGARELKTQLDQATRSARSVSDNFERFRIKAVLFNELSKFNSDIKTMNAELDDAIKKGDLVRITKIEEDILKNKRLLELLRNEFTKLGDSAKLQVVLQGVEKLDDLKQKVAGITEDVLQANRRKIVIQAEAQNEFATIKRDLNQLRNIIDKIGNKPIKVEVQTELQRGVQSLRARLQGVTSSLGRGAEKDVLKVGAGIRDVQGAIGNLRVPTGFFERFRLGISEISKNVGGFNAAAKGLATTFRLIGTTAFVAQLRTLGFAFTALSSVTQNLLPIIARLSQSFASAGPFGIVVGGTLATAVLGLASALAVLTVQLGATFGAIASIIPTGIEFNNLLERARNATAAVAQEFLSFTVDGQKFSDIISNDSEALEKFQIAQEAAGQQLEALQGQALTSLFTTEELFQTFQNLTIALGELNPSLDETTQLAGQFARVGGILGLSSDKLASSIAQVVAGTGRVTNSLQRLFNKTRDTEGRLLNPKRIRELRAAGGDRLFDELTAALGRYEKAAREANKQSFQGVISNFQDLFQILSGKATKSAFESVTKGLNAIFDGLVKETEKVKKTIDRFGQRKDIKIPVVLIDTELLRVVEIIDSFLDRIVKELTPNLRTVNDIIKFIGDFLEGNFNVLSDTVDLAIELAKSFGGLLLDFSKIVTFGATANTNFSVFNRILAAIVGTVNLIRLAFGQVLILIGQFKNALVDIGRFLLEIVKFQISIDPTGLTALFLGSAVGKFDKALNNLAKSGVRNVVEGLKTILDAQNSLLKIGKILDTEVFPRKRREKRRDISTTAQKFQSEDEEKAERERIKQTLNLELSLAEALRKLAQQREANELRLVQERLKQTQALTEEALNQNIIAQETAARKILEIQQKSIDNEIASRRGALALLNQERLDKEKIFADELQELVIQAQTDAGKGRLTKAELQNRIAQLGLKQEKERVELETQELVIQGDIAELELQRNNSQRDYIAGLVKRGTESRKELENLRLTVSELKGQNTEQTLNLRLLQVVQERLDNITKLDREINALRGARRNTIDQAQLALIDQQLSNNKELRQLLEQEIVLRQQILRFQASQEIADNARFRTERTLNTIQREVANGVIDEREGLIRATAERIKLRKALEQILKVQEDILKSNPFDKEAQKNVALLKEEIADLNSQVTDEGLLKGLDDARDSFTDFFVKIQEDIGSAKDAFADFGRSILNTFRKLLAEEVVNQFFSFLFPKKGQTQGSPTGVIADIFKSIGLNRGQKQQQEAERRAGAGTQLEQSEQQLLEQIKKGALNREQVLGNSIESLSQVIFNETEVLRIALNNLITSIDSAANSLNPIANDLEGILPDLSSIEDIINPIVSGRRSTLGRAGGGLIPARVSNGEYRMGGQAVKKYGTRFMDMVNSYADGGLTRLIDLAKFDFSGGGARLRNRPTPNIGRLPAVKKPNKKRGFFGNLLSFAAPFLGLIPGIGPFLQLGLGALGGGLTGGLGGAIFGGLSNLGGFSGKGGPLGRIGDFFSKGTGALLTKILGGRFANAGGFGGGVLLEILKKLGLFRSRGSLVDSPIPNLRGLGDVFAAKGGLIRGYAGGGSSSSSGGLSTTILSGIFSLLGLLNKPKAPKTPTFIEDPDLVNINRFGTALKPLRQAGIIPDFLFTKELDAALTAQESGRGDTGSQNQNSSRFGDILAGLLPFILAIFSNKRKADGGLISGPGTSTSDSILGLLSPGEYIIRASAVRGLGTSILDSINVGRFATGGLVGNDTITTLPSGDNPTSLNVESKTNVINVFDEKLLGNYINSTDGTKNIINLISRNPRAFRGALGL